MQVLRRDYDVVLRRTDPNITTSGNDDDRDRWMLVGTNADQVTAAKDYLECIVGERKCQETLIIPTHLHRYAIGRGGSTVRHIAETTRCLVQFPSSASQRNRSNNNADDESVDTEQDGIVITGAADQVTQAKRMIEEAVQRGQPRSHNTQSNSSEGEEA
ncbi:hypothetical protein BDF19DRAFT_452065 [Syncephalis fuscata]|nr:hypothetical protein BDF19DRAFT_452065 [Syncephalis fuscata]